MKRNQTLTRLASWIGIALLLSASSATAQTTIDDSEPARDTVDHVRDIGTEIVRDAGALRDELRLRDLDTDIADTALVFTNLGANATRVKCVAYDGDGQAIGRAWVGVPRLGVRYLLASDLANGADFIGQVQCSARKNIRGTAVFLGGGITDLPSMHPTRNRGRIRFPLVATY